MKPMSVGTSSRFCICMVVTLGIALRFCMSWTMRFMPADISACLAPTVLNFLSPTAHCCSIRDCCVRGEAEDAKERQR